MKLLGKILSVFNNAVSDRDRVMAEYRKVCGPTPEDRLVGFLQRIAARVLYR